MFAVKKQQNTHREHATTFGRVFSSCTGFARALGHCGGGLLLRYLALGDHAVARLWESFGVP